MATPPPDALVELALIGLQLHGAPLESTDEPAKTLKRALDHAVKQGLVELSSRREPHPTQTDKQGRPRRITVKRYALTEAGATRLRSLPDPELRALGQAAAMRALRQELVQVGAALQESLSQQIAESLAAVSAKLVAAEASPVRAPASAGDGLAAAYRALCRRVEYEDGLVDIPRLIRRAAEDTPGLLPQEARRELERLWQQDVLQLRVINEVHQLTPAERELGILHGNALHFYVYWPQERP